MKNTKGDFNMKLINYRCVIFKNYFISDNLNKKIYKYKFIKIKIMKFNHNSIS